MIGRLRRWWQRRPTTPAGYVHVVGGMRVPETILTDPPTGGYVAMYPAELARAVGAPVCNHLPDPDMSVLGTPGAAVCIGCGVPVRPDHAHGRWIPA